MYLRATEVLSDGQIQLSDEVLEKMNLLPGDHVAMICDNGRVMLRKLTSGDDKMSFEEFCLYRDVKNLSRNQERIARLIYSHLASVTGDERLLPDLMGRLIGIHASELTIPACSFSKIFDDEPPYGNADYYVNFSNDIRVYIYGQALSDPVRELRDNEYVIFMLADSFDEDMVRRVNRYVFVE